MDRELIIQSYLEWESFFTGLSDDEKKESSSIIEAAEVYNLQYYAVVKDYIKFDQVFNRLLAKYLYDEEIILTIFNCYLERELHELAFDYLNKAQLFYEKNGQPVPPVIKLIKDNNPDEKTIEKLKLILGNLPSQKKEDIPRILPPNLNGKLKLKEFILNEIIQASGVMVDKIEAIKDIKGEDRYNDFFIAILTLRFPIWGWGIKDQSRLGTSPAGKTAGEGDLIISASGNNIALAEAFILRDKAYTEKHILKVKNYIRSLDCYYIIIYNLNDQTDFDNNWQVYQRDVMNTNYPTDFEIDNTIGFIDLSKDFLNAQHLKIAKTNHHGGIEMFHIMIKLGK